MDNIIDLQNISKQYGQVSAVDNVSVQVAAGEIYGLLGNNGAGKSTLIKIMATVTEASLGDGRINGYSLKNNRRDVRRSIGYMPASGGLYADDSVRDYLTFFAACYKISAINRNQLIDNLLELVGISSLRDEKISRLSSGMRQRTNLARVLLHDPQVLLLDEPAKDLDPGGRIELLNLLVELAEQGKTIFMTSEILAEMADICTLFGFMENGRLAVSGRLETLRQLIMPKRKMVITLLDSVDPARQLLEKIPVIHKIHTVRDPLKKKHRLEMEYDGDDNGLGQILNYLTRSGIAVVEYKLDDHDLLPLFFKVSQEKPLKS